MRPNQTRYPAFSETGISSFSRTAGLTFRGPGVNLMKSMVNQTINEAGRGAGLSTRAYLLGELRKEPGAWVRGEVLAAGRGISRVAVWKGIRSLAAAGYPVTGGEAGYRLDPGGGADFLYPWEFGEREGLFRWFGRTGSTMDRARDYAEAGGRTDRGSGAAMVFTAETQSAGRGSRGRGWVSDSGGLFVTVLTWPGRALAEYPLVSMGAQIAAARTVGALTGKGARLRWPNDVYLGGKKIAGALTELSAGGDRIRWIAVGVGINVNNPAPVIGDRAPDPACDPDGGQTRGGLVCGPDCGPDCGERAHGGQIRGGQVRGEQTEDRAGAVSCAEIAGRRLSRREGLGIFLGELEKLRGAGAGELRDAWNSLAGGIGAPVTVIPAGHGEAGDPGRAGGPAEIRRGVRARGRFAGIDSRGRCRVLVETGRGGKTVSRSYAPGTASLLYRGPVW
jgi:biotin operon repressor